MAEPIGFAASIVTLAALAGQSYEKLYNFQLKLRNAPADIRRLVAEARTLNTLLEELHKTIEETRNYHISPSLLALWVEKEKGLRDDLNDFGKFTEGLESALERHSIGSAHAWARLKRILSEEKVLSYQRKFADHIRIVSFIELQLQGSLVRSMRNDTSQLTIIRTEASSSGIALQHRLGETHSMIKDEMEAIREELTHMRTTSTSTRGSCADLLLAASTSQPQSSLSMGCLELSNPVCTGPFEFDRLNRISMRTIASRRSRQVSWKWRTYKLPIGTLSITELEELVAHPSESHERSGKRYRTTFTLALPKWLQERILHVTYDILAQASCMPYWQRTQMGTMTILPPDVMKAAKDLNLMEIGRFFAGLSPEGIKWTMDYLHACRNHSYPFKLEAGKIISTPDDILGYDYILSIHDRALGCEQYLLLRYRSYLHYYGNRVLLDPAYKYFTFHIIESNARVADLHDFTKILVPPIRMSNAICCSNFFKRYFADHIDIEFFEHYKSCDRWWLGAIILTRPTFAHVLRSALDNSTCFSRPTALKSLNRALSSVLDYQFIAREVMEATCWERCRFVKWICSSGTKAMLEPLIQEGLDVNELSDECLGYIDALQPNKVRKSYLFTAVESRNVGVFEILAAAGAFFGKEDGPVWGFISGTRTADDGAFFENVLALLPRLPGNEGASSLIQYWGFHTEEGPQPEADLYFSRRLIETGNAWGSFPPYHLDHFLAMDVMVAVSWNDSRLLHLLLDQGASLDYLANWGPMEGYSALLLAVELAYLDPLKLVLSKLTTSLSHRSLLRQAIVLSKANLQINSGMRIMTTICPNETDIHHNRLHHRGIMKGLMSGHHLRWLRGGYFSFERPHRAFKIFTQTHELRSDWGAGVTLLVDKEVHSLLVKKIEEMGGVETLNGIEELPRNIVSEKMEMMHGPKFTPEPCGVVLHQTLKKAKIQLSRCLAMAYRSILALAKDIASMSPMDFLLVSVGLVVTLRALIEMQAWLVLIWLWSIPRPPRAFWQGLLALIIGVTFNYYLFHS